MELIEYIFYLLRKIYFFLRFAYNGYIAHFIIGFLIGGIVSFLIFKKTNSKVKSLIIGCTMAGLIGLFKEFIEPFIGGSRDILDFIFTFIGGFLGSYFMIFSSIRLRINKRSDY